MMLNCDTLQGECFSAALMFRGKLQKKQTDEVCTKLFEQMKFRKAGVVAWGTNHQPPSFVPGGDIKA